MKNEGRIKSRSLAHGIVHHHSGTSERKNGTREQPALCELLRRSAYAFFSSASGRRRHPRRGLLERLGRDPPRRLLQGVAPLPRLGDQRPHEQLLVDRDATREPTAGGRCPRRGGGALVAVRSEELGSEGRELGGRVNGKGRTEEGRVHIL